MDFNDIEKLRNDSKNIIKNIIKGMKNKDSLIRADSLQILSLFFEKKIQDKILYLLNDPNNLVQVEAIETLSILDNNKFLYSIRKKLKSKDWLVRAYATEVVGDFYDIQSKKILIGNLKDAHKEEKPRIYYALIKLGEEKYFKNLYKCLNHSHYRIRIATSNLLYYLINKKNKNKILKHLKKRLLKEKEKSVISTLKGTIKDIKSGDVYH